MEDVGRNAWTAHSRGGAFTSTAVLSEGPELPVDAGRGERPAEGRA